MAIDQGLGVGALVLCLDFAAWRLIGRDRVMARTLTRAVLFAGLTVVLFHFGMSPFASAAWPEHTARHFGAAVLGLIWWLQGAQLFTVLLDRVILPKTWQHERLFQDVFGALVFLAAAIAGVTYVLELPVAGILATSGAVAVILGLAIQSTLNDVFSGVVLNATQPFHLGDWVSIGGVDGQVVESNWRATSLMNGQGNIVTIPNSVAAKANIVNNSQPTHVHGVVVSLRIAPEIRPATVLEALESATLSHEQILTNPKPMVSVRTADTDAIEYEMVCFVDALSKKLPVRNALFDLAYRHLAAAGVDLRSLSVPRPVDGDRGRVGAGADIEAGPLAGSNVKLVASGDRSWSLLRHVAIFQTLNADEIGELHAALTRREFHPGEQVYASSEVRANNALFIVAHGVARVTLPRVGEEVELRRMVPGDSIGQSGILSGVKFNATVRAVTRVVVYELAEAALSVMLARRPDIAQRMCQTLSEHYASEANLLAGAVPAAHHDSGLYEWLKEGMVRLHKLTH